MTKTGESIDKKIIEFLLQNNKIATTKIAKALKESESTVRDHLQKLVERNIIAKEGSKYYVPKGTLKLITVSNRVIFEFIAVIVFLVFGLVATTYAAFVAYGFLTFSGALGAVSIASNYQRQIKEKEEALKKLL